MIIIKNFAGTGTAKVYHCETGDFGSYANSFQMTDGAMSADYFAVHSKQTSEYFTVKNNTDYFATQAEEPMTLEPPIPRTSSQGAKAVTQYLDPVKIN